MGIVCINGASLEEPPPRPGEAPAYHFESGVYETLRTMRGMLFNWLAHRERLDASARAIGISLSRERLDDIGMYAQATVATNRENWGGDREAKVRVQVDPEGHYYIQTTPLAELLGKDWRKGISAATVTRSRRDPEVKRIDPDFAQWATEQKRDLGVRELLLVNESGHVTEGSMTNVFIVEEGNVLRTPDEGMLKGTTRARVLEAAFDFDMAVKLGPVTVEELLGAREVFVCNVISEVVPVVKVDGRPIGTGSPGFVTARLAKALKDDRLSSQPSL